MKFKFDIEKHNQYIKERCIDWYAVNELILPASYFVIHESIFSRDRDRFLFCFTCNISPIQNYFSILEPWEIGQELRGN